MDEPRQRHDRARPVIVWFRDDLRLANNPALAAAAALARPLVPIFVHDETGGLRPLGGAARWWLHGSLQALKDALDSRGGRLLIFQGPAAEIVPRLARNCGASLLFWNRRYGLAQRPIDESVKMALQGDWRRSEELQRRPAL